MNNKTSRWIFFLIIILSLLSFIPLRDLRFNLDIENYFSAADPEAGFYKEFQYQFQTDGEFLLIGLHNKEGIFKEAFLKKTEALTNYLTSLEQIKKVYSLTNTNIIFFRDSLINARRLIQINEPQLYAADSVYLFQSPEYRDLLVSKDGKTIAVAAFHNRNLNEAQKIFLIERIKNKLEALQFDKTHFVSKVKTEITFIEYLVKNAKVIALISFLTLALALLVMYRSFSLMCLLLMPIVLPATWVLAIISLHYPFDLFMFLLPLLLVMMAIPGVIFISDSYINLSKKGFTRQQAIAYTKKQSQPALMISYMAVAVAFFGFTFSNITALKNFGLVAGLGLLLTCTLTIYLLPAFIPVAPFANRRDPKSNNRRWERFLFAGLRTALKNKIAVSLAIFLIAAASLFIIARIKLNENLLAQMPSQGSLYEDLSFMENEFGGAYPFEVVLTAQEKQISFLNLLMLKKVEEFENFLKDSCNANAVISPVPLFKGANKAFHGGENEHFQLPASASNLQRFNEAIMQTEHAEELSQYMLADGSRVRISGRLNKHVASDFKSFDKKLQGYLNRNNYGGYFSYQITGPSILLEKSFKNITHQFLLSLSVVFFFSLVFSFFLLPRLSVIFIAFITNCIQLLLMAACMEITEINLNASTALFFLIAFAVATTGSLHFFHVLKTKQANGTSNAFAIKYWYETFASSLLKSSILLIAFCVCFLFTGLKPIAHTSLLLIASVLISLVIHSFLVPFLFIAWHIKPKSING